MNASNALTMEMKELGSWRVLAGSRVCAEQGTFLVVRGRARKDQKQQLPVPGKGLMSLERQEPEWKKRCAQMFAGKGKSTNTSVQGCNMTKKFGETVHGTNQAFK